MPAPVITFVNSTEVVISWRHDNFHVGGPVIRYEVRMAFKNESDYRIEINGSKDRFTVNLDKIKNDWSPDCSNASVATNLYNFTIRSVVKEDTSNSDEFISNWSPVEVVPAPCGGKIQFFITFP
jgi:hypothetical protein